MFLHSVILQIEMGAAYRDGPPQVNDHGIKIRHEVAVPIQNPRIFIKLWGCLFNHFEAFEVHKMEKHCCLSFVRQ